MRYTLAFCSLLLVNTLAMGQAPVIEWEKSLGGSDYESGRKIQQTADGGYIVAGHTFSTDGHINNQHGIYDAWLVKLRADRSIEWQKCLGGSNDDGAYYVEQTSDLGFIIAGFTKSTDGDITQMKGMSDCWFIKTDAAGNIQWQKTYGGSALDVAAVIKQVPGEGYIAAGYTKSNDGDVTNSPRGGQNFWLIKLDNNGKKEWDKCFGGSGDDFCYSLDLAPGGGYILAGNSRSPDGDVTGGKGSYDLWVIKTDTQGNLVWQKTYGGSKIEQAGEVKATTDGGCILVGATESANGDLFGNEGGTDGLVLKLDANGNMQWLWQAGGNKTDHFASVVERNGKYLVAGSTESTTGSITTKYGQHDCFVVQLSAVGTTDWTAHYGGNMLDDILSITPTTDGGFVFTGSSFSTNQDISNSIGAGDMWVVKIKVQVQLPIVEIQPPDANACIGSSVNFILTGRYADSYQWQIWDGAAWQSLTDNTGYLGTKTNQLVIISANTPQKFRCILRNAFGEIISNTSNLSIIANPTINITPLASSVCNGIPILFTAQHTGATSFTWQKKTGNSWQTIGTGSSSFQIAAAALSDAGEYRCIAANACNNTATSNLSTVVVTECQKPLIDIQPGNKAACEGSNSTLSITASRADQYQWQKLEAGVWKSLTDNVEFTGTQTNQLNVTGMKAAVAGAYRCIVKNLFGETISAEANLTLQLKPTINITPVNANGCTGAAVTFTANAIYANTYTWQKKKGNGWENKGQDDQLYTIPNTAMTDAGQYRCMASNDCGSTTSNIVLLEVNNCSIPNAFSPNGDGVNDIWAIYFLQNHPKSSVRVFARDGSLVFESRNGYSKPWDGTRNGQSLPVGVYYYIVSTNNNTADVKGSVTIIR